MKENYTYPIKLKKMLDVCLVTFPDFPGQMTEGESQEEAVWAARELLALCISSNEDRGIENPSPSEPGQIVTEEGEKLIYVHLWMPYFRQIQKTIYVKKTLTIPKYPQFFFCRQNQKSIILPQQQFYCCRNCFRTIFIMRSISSFVFLISLGRQSPLLKISSLTLIPSST